MTLTAREWFWIAIGTVVPVASIAGAVATVYIDKHDPPAAAAGMTIGAVMAMIILPSVASVGFALERRFRS